MISNIKTKTLKLCGAIACPLFIIAVLVEGAIRPNYNSFLYPLSSLSIGDTGWTQNSNFIFAGILLVAFSFGLKQVCSSRLRPDNPHLREASYFMGNCICVTHKNFRQMTIRLFSIILIVFLLFGCNGGGPNSGNSSTTNMPIPTIDFVSIKSYPHDTTSFTEGLLIHNGDLFESTGATRDLPQTKSLFGIVDLTTGKIDAKVKLDRVKYFGEGITFLNGKVFQLTYKTKVGFIYDATSFKKIGEFTFPGEEGWGMTTDGKYLIMSDGTYKLTYLDPINFQVIKSVSVTENGYVKENLNELEYIKGYLYANIWMKNIIVKIDPTSGKVIGQIDLTPLTDECKNINPGSLEMNGIAYDSIKDKIFVTGKLWPKVYEIKIND